MKLTISREALLKPLLLVAGVVERRQTLPVLSNVLLVADKDQLLLTGTDLEVELVGRVALEAEAQTGEITVPARKLVDICKSLPDGSQIELRQEDQKIILKAGRSKFTLATLPASDFPNIEDSPSAIEFSVPKASLKRLIDSTSFAMAQQDVRYYLNGMLLEVKKGHLRTVATDGHRLAMCTVAIDFAGDTTHQVIVPRKGILELLRLIGDGDGDVAMSLSSNHLRARSGEFTFTSKLVDGKFPDYERVLPKGGNKEVLGDRRALKEAFSRVAILSNEKYRGVRLVLTNGVLRILANNPDQEEAEEEINVNYEGDALEIGFNVSYLQDVLNTLATDQIKITLLDANSSALVEEAEKSDAVYVVMPMRL
jgi:DNA polymerase-3 subunit beta